jgi:hypothetical protein
MTDATAAGPTEEQRARNRWELDLAQIGARREEAAKFTAEQRKLIAEAAKLDRDRWLAPWTLVTALSSGAVVIVAQLILKRLGWL